MYSMCSSGARLGRPSNASAVRLPEPVTMTTIALPLDQPDRSVISRTTAERSLVRWARLAWSSVVHAAGDQLAYAPVSARALMLARDLVRVLVAQCGVEPGSDAAADALGYGWEHWDRIGQMANPVGYPYRVAQSSVRRQRRWSRDVSFPAIDAGHVDREVDSELFDVLARLSPL